MTTTFNAILLSAIPLLSLGCATDPNKQIRHANADHVSDVQDSDKDRTKLEAKQEIDHAALDSEHQKQDVALDKTVSDDAGKFVKARENAESNVFEARRVFRANATARLENVDAKVTVLEKSRDARKMNATTISAVRTNFLNIRKSVDKLDSVSAANWFAVKDGIEVSLVDLEKDVKALEAGF